MYAVKTIFNFILLTFCKLYTAITKFLLDERLSCIGRIQKKLFNPFTAGAAERRPPGRPRMSTSVITVLN